MEAQNNQPEQTQTQNKTTTSLVLYEKANEQKLLRIVTGMTTGSRSC
jgi:hypothetical protein